MMQTIRPGKKLIKLIKFLTGKETHKTHKLIRGGFEGVSTGKETHKTHKTHSVSTGKKLIKLIKSLTYEFLNAAPWLDGRFMRFGEDMSCGYEFYEFPLTPTCEEKQYCTRDKTCTRGDCGETHKTHKTHNATEVSDTPTDWIFRHYRGGI